MTTTLLVMTIFFIALFIAAAVACHWLDRQTQTLWDDKRQLGVLQQKHRVKWGSSPHAFGLSDAEAEVSELERQVQRMERLMPWYWRVKNIGITAGIAAVVTGLPYVVMVFVGVGTG